MNRYYVHVQAPAITSFYSYVTCREAADLLKVHLTTIQRLTKNGTIPSIKVGKSVRIPLRWLNEQVKAVGK